MARIPNFLRAISWNFGLNELGDPSARTDCISTESQHVVAEIILASWHEGNLHKAPNCPGVSRSVCVHVLMCLSHSNINIPTLFLRCFHTCTPHTHTHTHTDTHTHINTHTHTLQRAHNAHSKTSQASCWKQGNGSFVCTNLEGCLVTCRILSSLSSIC